MPLLKFFNSWSTVYTIHLKFISLPLNNNVLFHVKSNIISWVPVTQVCYPSYSGVRDQEDHGSKPTLDK
jgi:hypothetical protein